MDGELGNGGTMHRQVIEKVYDVIRCEYTMPKQQNNYKNLRKQGRQYGVPGLD